MVVFGGEVLEKRAGLWCAGPDSNRHAREGVRT
jgi:hypothetical protein